MKHPNEKSRREFLEASSMLGVAIAFDPRMIGEAFPNPKSKSNTRRHGMGQTSARATDTTAIRPFHVSVPEAEVNDLRRRINATKWPERETVTDASQGVQLATIQKLAHYWANDYDWHKCETRLNALPQFMTNIDGLDIHFIHVRSKNPNALPVIITHGWPGSIIEQMKIIDPLTNPTAHGGSASDAFDVVIPSLPGHGFSGKPTAPGWTGWPQKWQSTVACGAGTTSRRGRVARRASRRTRAGP